jgi:hypothetical protein
VPTIFVIVDQGNSEREELLHVDRIPSVGERLPLLDGTACVVEWVNPNPDRLPDATVRCRPAERWIS